MLKYIPSPFFFYLIFLLLSLAGGCTSSSTQSDSLEELYKLFVDPPAESRPFVRWWWNGTMIETEELERELDVMKAAGIGGVEINPIAHPEGPDLQGHKACDWLSPEWNDRIKFTIKEASKRALTVDLILKYHF